VGDNVAVIISSDNDEQFWLLSWQDYTHNLSIIWRLG
jgi:hypothetical protein